jgi:hypothetical protein
VPKLSSGDRSRINEHMRRDDSGEPLFGLAVHSALIVPNLLLHYSECRLETVRNGGVTTGIREVFSSKPLYLLGDAVVSACNSSGSSHSTPLFQTVPTHSAPVALHDERPNADELVAHLSRNPFNRSLRQGDHPGRLSLC